MTDHEAVVAALVKVAEAANLWRKLRNGPGHTSRVRKLADALDALKLAERGSDGE